MTYKKFLIVASKKDPAGVNITTQLSQFNSDKFKFYLCEEEIIYTENLDLEKINQFDFIIFASKHASSNKEKALCIHSPGNPRNADFGGEKGKICPTSSQLFKYMFETLNKNAEEHYLTKHYNVTMEATHHGPKIDKPCLFVEVGATENEWKDRKAAFVLAKTISETIETFQPNPYSENAIAIGGPHYCPNFNKVQLRSNVAISHVIAQYNLPLTEEMVKEAIEKTDEEIDLAVLDWKGLGNSEQRQQVLDILDKLYIRYEKSKSVRK